jgi:hypothetical protein
MNLAKLIRGKNETVAVATAISAISATQPKGEAGTVARIATVAMASPTSEKTAPPAKASPSDPETHSTLWLLHYLDRDPMEVSVVSGATRAEMLAWHPDAVAIEPLPDRQAGPRVLKGMDSEKCQPSQLQKLQKPPFYSFRSTKGGRFQEIEASTPAATIQAGPYVTLSQLPERLVTTASRACVKIHGDDDAAVQEMLVDLTWNDPKDWDVLIEHFERQLPPATKPLVRCSGCRHAEYSPHHPGIIHCRVGVESGAATAGWFATDKHLCGKREEPHA